MDLVKERQRLSYRERTNIHFGDAEIDVHRYQHLGRGLLPWDYYVDESGRLLLAISGIRACILLGPEAARVKRHHAEVIAELRTSTGARNEMLQFLSGI
jgi:hypothetical protein